MKQTRVLIVDDSGVMRRLIENALCKDPAISIVDSVADPFQAREAIKRTNPDVITLDVEMPQMDGLSFLRNLMRLRPTPVVMVSNLTQRGANTTLRALELGAVDCVCKPTQGGERSFDELPAKVRAAHNARLRIHQANIVKVAATNGSYAPNGSIVAIGASTGGVDALLTVLSSFPANCPPTVIAQHMPALFTRSFAERLNRNCAAHVTEAADGAPLRAGHIYLAPGEHTHLEVVGAKKMPHCRLSTQSPVSGHRPSVDVLFRSVARTVGAHAVGVILTGMGRDGADGLYEMRQMGALTLGQDEQSSLIFGMPRAAYERGAVVKQTPLPAIGAQILAHTNLSREGS